MRPIAHTKGWSRSAQMGPIYSGVPGGLCLQTYALEYSDLLQPCLNLSGYTTIQTPRQRPARSHPLVRFSQSLQKSLNRSGASAV
jgi:hypothetical protein